MKDNHGFPHCKGDCKLNFARRWLWNLIYFVFRYFLSTLLSQWLISRYQCGHGWGLLARSLHSAQHVFGDPSMPCAECYDWGKCEDWSSLAAELLYFVWSVCEPPTASDSTLVEQAPILPATPVPTASGSAPVEQAYIPPSSPPILGTLLGPYMGLGQPLRL